MISLQRGHNYKSGHSCLESNLNPPLRKNDQISGGGACRHAQYVDTRKKLSLNNVANEECEIVFKHGLYFLVVSPSVLSEYQ